MVKLSGDIRNLMAYWIEAQTMDKMEGMKAYCLYREVMEAFASFYGFPLDKVVGAFVTLSPNNDYVGNIRSLVSCLSGVREGLPPHSITVSTYGGNKRRAIALLKGGSFAPNGPKITSFYHNILYPDNEDWVTIDGHMVGCWTNTKGTMKDFALKLTLGKYREIERDFRLLARCLGILPNQLQAVLWFTRKRKLEVKYNPNYNMFAGEDDFWNIRLNPSSVKPFLNKQEMNNGRQPLSRSGRSPSDNSYGRSVQASPGLFEGRPPLCSD